MGGNSRAEIQRGDNEKDLLHSVARNGLQENEKSEVNHASTHTAAITRGVVGIDQSGCSRR